MKIVLIIWFATHGYGVVSETIEGFSSMDACISARAEIHEESEEKYLNDAEIVRTYCIRVD